MVLETEKLEEREHYTPRDAAEGEEVVEMIQVRRREHGYPVQKMADDVREELEKELEAHRRCYDLMRKSSGVVEGSLIFLWDWKIFPDGLTVPSDSPACVESLTVSTG